MITMERYSLQKQHIAEEYEKNRLYERQLQREERRQQRFDTYLSYERNEMIYEDKQSYSLREYEYEQIREGIERENLFNEECDQCEIDRFWSIDTYYSRLNDEEKRLARIYIEQVIKTNEQLSFMKLVKKNKKEYYSSYLPKLSKTMDLIKTTNSNSSSALIASQSQKKIKTIEKLPLISPKGSSAVGSPSFSLKKGNHNQYDFPDDLSMNSSMNGDGNIRYHYNGSGTSSTSGSVMSEEDIKRQLDYEQQYQLNQIETTKRMEYIKKLKAEELRMKAQVKIRPALHLPK
jgi:hypothetical protein